MIVRTKIIGHYSLLITRYSLLIARNTNTLNKIEKRIIKARHNHFTQVRNAATVFTTEESFGLIEF